MRPGDVPVGIAFAIGCATGAAIGVILLGGYAALDLVQRAVRR